MPKVSFTPNLDRHVNCSEQSVPSGALREALDSVFDANPALRGYVVDEQGRLRKHMNIFINGRMIGDRAGLTDAVGEDDEIYVMQALSGG